jgi:hypothetical protein
VRGVLSIVAREEGHASATKKVGPRAAAYFLPEHLLRPYYDSVLFEQQSTNLNRAMLTMLRFE